MVEAEEIFIFDKMVEGNKEAFKILFEKYYPDLCNLVNLYLQNSTVSEEIVQDLFIYLWEKREKIKIETSLKAYLLQAAKYKSLNYIRNEKNKNLILNEITDREKVSLEMPDRAMDANQLREIIENSINSLPERCRQVYIMGKERNMTYKEISEEMGISVKTVEVQMGNALKKLREQLRPHYQDIFIFFLIWLNE